MQPFCLPDARYTRGVLLPPDDVRARAPYVRALSHPTFPSIDLHPQPRRSTQTGEPPAPSRVYGVAGVVIG